MTDILDCERCGAAVLVLAARHALQREPAVGVRRSLSAVLCVHCEARGKIAVRPAVLIVCSLGLNMEVVAIESAVSSTWLTQTRRVSAALTYSRLMQKNIASHIAIAVNT